MTMMVMVMPPEIFGNKQGATAKFNRKQIPKFHFVKFWKKNRIMCKYRQRAFIWMVTDHRTSSEDSEATLQNSIKHSGNERVK